MFAELAITLALRATEAATRAVGPVGCATADPVRFPCPPTPGIVVETFADPHPCGDPLSPDFDYCVNPNFRG